MTTPSALLLRLLQIPKFGPSAVNKIISQIDITDLLDYDEVAFTQIGWSPAQIRAWFQPQQRYIEPALQWAEDEGNSVNLLRAGLSLSPKTNRKRATDIICQRKCR